MPACCLSLPRFIRRPRSQHSDPPKPLPAGPREDATAARSLYPSPSPALSPLPPSTHSSPERDVLATPGTSFLPAPSSLSHPQNSMGRLSVDRASGDSSGQPSQVSRPITVTKFADSISAPKLSAQDSVAQPPVHLPPPPNSLDSTRSQVSSHSLKQCSSLEQQSQPSGEGLPNARHQNQGMILQAHKFSATGHFIGENISAMNCPNNSNNFMRDLLRETIPGAASDSSARDPPPRCHPGTRLAILERCLYFIAHCDRVKKMRWVVGVAGVGKSAVMQSVVESPLLEVTSNASVFFSINGRNDGTKTIMTLSYQFAAKSNLYRQVIEDQVSRDPRLLQSSMSVQFENFIVQPFIHNPYLNSAGRVLIIIDGLDECNNTRTQIELLHLISSFCLSYPSSPVVWLIASRPEAHIVSFFSRSEVVPAYEKEEILVDSDEARADVERFLRAKLTEIREASDFLDPQWPDEQHLWKLAKAAGGLFAYAQTVIRYIGDSDVGDPVSQLSDVLNVIDELPLSDVPRDQHPMAQLDALYIRILSNVPPRIMIHTRKLLLALASKWDWSLYPGASSFILLCNWLGMTADEAYAAINRLRSVFYAPRRDRAHREELKPYHKTIIDHLSDFSRSGFSRDIKHEAQLSRVQCAFRILKLALDGIDFGDVEYKFYYGNLARGAGPSDKISLAWPGDGGVRDDNELKLMMYKMAIGQVVSGVDQREPTCQSLFCIRLLITRFQNYSSTFPYDRLRDLVFDEQQRVEFMTSGLLVQVPLKAITSSHGVIKVKFRFRRLASTTVTNLRDPWKPSCSDLHEQDHELEEGTGEDWTTNLWRDCPFCLERLKNQRQALSPGHVVWVLFTSTGDCCVELDFVDPEDGISKWTYWFWISLSLEERKKYGSIV